MWHHSHNGVIIMITDGLVPIWPRSVCHHHDYVNWWKNIRAESTQYPFLKSAIQGTQHSKCPSGNDLGVGNSYSLQVQASEYLVYQSLFRSPIIHIEWLTPIGFWPWLHYCVNIQRCKHKHTNKNLSLDRGVCIQEHIFEWKYLTFGWIQIE